MRRVQLATDAITVDAIWWKMIWDVLHKKKRKLYFSGTTMTRLFNGRSMAIAHTREEEVVS